MNGQIIETKHVMVTIPTVIELVGCAFMKWFDRFGSGLPMFNWKKAQG